MAEGGGKPLAPVEHKPIVTLRVKDGDDAGRTIELGMETVIGRDSSADVVLADATGRLSRYHARIDLRGGAAVLEDLASKNGTFLNGARLTGPRALRPGDEITLGASTLEFAPIRDPEATRIRVDPDAATRITAGPHSWPRSDDGELRILSGPGAGSTVRVIGGSATIGREPGCDLVVLHTEVSRRHAKVTIRDGVAAISDLSSANGTYVNGERITTVHALRAGDKIQIGEATIELTSHVFEHATEPEPAPVVEWARPSEVAPAAVSDVTEVASPEVSEQRTPRSGARLLAESGTIALPGAAEGQITPRRWLALAILLVAGFMDLLDTTIVNVAIPSIRASINAGFASVQWLIDGYLLAVAVLLITGARLGDAYGRKRVFVSSVCAFGLASLASGLAPNAGALVGTRVLQGLSAAVMIPQILSVIQVNFPREEQSKALALYSSVAGVAVMTGPLMAGVLLDVFKLSWRSIFLVNVPVCVIVAVAAVAIVPESRSSRADRLDLGGIALISSALFALVFGIIEGRSLGWPIWDIALIVAAVPLALLFARFENAAERRGTAPLVSISIFRERAFSSGLIVVVVFFSGLVGFFLAFTIFLQIGLGFTPLESALTTFPSSVGLVIASQISNRLTRRLGRRLLSAGALVMAAAQAGLILTVHSAGAHLTAWEVRPVILVFGLGMGLILPSLADVIIGHVHEGNAGAASGIVNTGLQVGNAIGVALIGVILFSTVSSHALASAKEQQRALGTTLAAAGVQDPVRTRLLTDYRQCFVDKAHKEDPDAVPPSCRREAADEAVPASGQTVKGALSVATIRGRENNFVVGIQWALGYEVAVFLATFALLFLIPRAGRSAVNNETALHQSDM